MPVALNGRTRSGELPRWVPVPISQERMHNSSEQAERGTVDHNVRDMRLLRDLRANRAARLAAAADPCPPNDEWSAFLLRDSRHRHEAAHMLDRQSAWYTPPQPSVFLHPGTTFKGTQLVSRRSRVREDWDVVVSIEECDWARGSIAGSMIATAVPQAKSPVTTFWEGEIVGCGNHKFHSCQGKWDATRSMDISHWTKFQGFLELQRVWRQGQVQSSPQPSTSVRGGSLVAQYRRLLESRESAGNPAEGLRGDPNRPVLYSEDEEEYEYAGEDGEGVFGQVETQLPEELPEDMMLDTARPSFAGVRSQGDSDDGEDDDEEDTFEDEVADMEEAFAEERQREAQEGGGAAGPHRRYLDIVAAIRARQAAEGGNSMLQIEGSWMRGFLNQDAAGAPRLEQFHAPIAQPPDRQAAVPVSPSEEPSQGVSVDRAADGSEVEAPPEEHIYMRWKERFFDGNPSDDCGLTIAGFYYVEMSRVDGSMTAYYCDHNSAPFQKLDLQLVKPGLSQQSSHYDFN